MSRQDRKPMTADALDNMRAAHTADVIQIYDGFEPARRAMSDPKSSGEVRDCAAAVLMESTIHADQRAVSHYLRMSELAHFADLRDGGNLPPRFHVLDLMVAIAGGILAAAVIGWTAIGIFTAFNIAALGCF